MRAICAVRYATGILAALTSSIPSGIRQRLSFRTASHSLSAPSSKTPYGPVNITREPTGKSVPPPSSTTPAPSLPRTSGAFAGGKWPERIVWSRGVTPAAVIRSKTFPSETAGDCLHDLIGTFYRTPRRRVRITWTYRIYPNAPTLQIRCPCPRERTYGGFCGAINTPLRRSFFGNDRRIQDDGGTIRHERKRLLYREEKTLHISVKK